MKTYNFGEYTDQELLDAEQNFTELRNHKVMNMIFDESLDIIEEYLSRIEVEKERRGLL